MRIEKELGHVEVIDWVTIPMIDNRIAVVIAEKDALVRVIIWNDIAWSEYADWLFATLTVPMEADSKDPRLPDAQRAWSQRQIEAIRQGSWTNGKEEGDEGST